MRTHKHANTADSAVTVTVTVAVTGLRCATCNNPRHPASEAYHACQNGRAAMPVYAQNNP